MAQSAFSQQYSRFHPTRWASMVGGLRIGKTIVEWLYGSHIDKKVS